MTAISYEIVIPTSGRPELTGLLDAIARTRGPRPERVIVERDAARRGPAATRNAGWRRGAARWVCFLDDDVLVAEDWAERLAHDLAAADASGAGGSQGRIVVPLPADRRPTDWERNVAGLEAARWATADMAYRRDVLEAIGGFDERFPRAYREDADVGLRVTGAGWAIERGSRSVVHPVGPSDWQVSLGRQAGNWDDPLMRRLHGRDWRERAGVPPGRRPWHLATTLAPVVCALAGRPGLGAALYAAGTGDLAWRRIAPGPRTPREVATMLATSAAMPPLATWHYARGLLRARNADPLAAAAIAGPAAAASPATAAASPATAAASPAPAASRTASRPKAVLFDRDGTLVVDVPYNGDPEKVQLVEGAWEALDRLRRAGIPVGVVSNQSGIARGLITSDQVEAVNARIEELLGPFDTWTYCPHGPEDGCDCRKPAPGLIERAARDIGVRPEECVVIGDIGADVQAARAAGARSVLVPTRVTRREEVADAEQVAPDIVSAVERALQAA